MPFRYRSLRRWKYQTLAHYAYPTKFEPESELVLLASPDSASFLACTAGALGESPAVPTRRRGPWEGTLVLFQEASGTASVLHYLDQLTHDADRGRIALGELSQISEEVGTFGGCRDDSCVAPALFRHVSVLALLGGRVGLEPG